MRYESLSINGGPVVFDDDGHEAFRDDYVENVREWLESRKISSVEYDADGNGSIVLIPTEWIGDGSPLHMSRRCLDLIS